MYKCEYPSQLWRTYNFTNRLEFDGVWDAIYDNPNDFLFIENSMSYGTTNNNGNLLGLSEYVSAPGQPGVLTGYSQSFTYDGVNRLKSASDSGGWWRNFAYDAFGNGWVPSTSSQMSYGPATPNGNVYNTKNQIGSSPYDAAGNMLALPPGMSFTYDAENRQVAETNSGGPSATYFYDSEGKRVKKALNTGQTIVYVYDAMGNLTAEYNSGVTAPPCTTCYFSYDHLGSLRMVTDANANVVYRHDYLPFGDEVPGGVAARNTQFGASDNISQRFTGKERDTETSLDFFGARYYALGIERFMSPDPTRLGAFVDNPQSWNSYAYVYSRPLTLTDANGKWPPAIHNQIIDAAFPNLTPEERNI